MKQAFLVSALLFGVFANVCEAEFRHIDLTIFGMDWAVCAHAVSVSIKKIQGVQSVDVSLNRGLATITLRSGNKVRVEQLRQAITNNGFTPVEAKITAVGTLVSSSGKLQFQVVETGEVLNAALDPAVSSLEQRVQNAAGKKVIAEGSIVFEKNKASPNTFLIKAIAVANSQ